MNRPTIALACIMKNEMDHIKSMLASVQSCFDEIWITDTGSTDGSLEFARSKEASEIAGCPVHVNTFTWIDDFAAARNHSMKDIKTDYVMWMDLDDRLSDITEFKRWRDQVMELGDFWLAKYNYSIDKEGNPTCIFLRERVIKTSKKFKWQFFIHEGMIAEEPVSAQLINNWTINHHRTLEDYEKDFARNVSMLEKRAKTEELPTRLKFYYGKELFDKQRYQEAYVWLDQVVDNPTLEHHDRVLTFEYLCRTCLHRFQQEQDHKPPQSQDMMLLAKCAALALQGVTLEPNRAELWCLAGDAMIRLNRPQDALPLYSAASRCSKNNTKGFLFVSAPAYESVPLDQMARIKFQLGDMDGGIAIASESVQKYQKAESQNLLKEMLQNKERITTLNTGVKTDTDEIVFSCIPGSHPYAFDDKVYQEQGVGGSETALIEVAKHIKRMVGTRRVIVFNTRDAEYRSPDGVEYLPAQTMHEYFSKFKPAAHFAWRHNIKLTSAPTYLWTHDLYTAGAEAHSNYLKQICLTPFHKDYVMTQQQVPESKIVLSRNGVNAERFEETITKNENKIVFPSSPDRGLEHAIGIVEKARLFSGRDLELHVYYGVEHLEKYGPHMAALAERLKAQFAKYPWIKYHGKVDQKTLAREMMEAVVWLYPATFIESFCITAIEAMYAKCFPLVREIGALKDTVRPFADQGMAELVFHDPADHQFWAERLVSVLDKKPWQKMHMIGQDYSWSGVAQDFMNLAHILPEKKEAFNPARFVPLSEVLTG